MKKILAKVKQAIYIRVKCLYEYIWYHMLTWYRGHFQKDRFVKLEGLKDKYKGQRCFLIGTGPSLVNEDLLKLKDEYTFGVNSIAGAMEELDFYPSFYGFIDAVCLDLYGDKIINNKKSKVFFTRRHDLSKEKYRQLVQMENSYEFLMTDPGQWIYFAKKMPRGFSEDAAKSVEWGYTCVYSMLQLITYMGFEDIYLLGMDCRYAKGVKCFKDYRNEKEIAEAGETGGGEVVDNYIIAYRAAKEYCDQHDIHIYNATRGGSLEIFPRVDLDELLGKGKNK